MNGVIRFWFAPVLLLVGGIVLAAVVDGDDAVDLPVKYWQCENRPCAGGYDVVAYFDESAAVRGKGEIQEYYDGQLWLFSSKENRDKFAKNPAKYIPQYGGHCAFGVAGDYLVKGDPRAWTVKDGKLYLNFNKSVRTNWLSDPDGYIARSEKNWPGLLAKP